MAVEPDIINLEHTQSLTSNPFCLSDPSDIASHLRSACFLPEGDPIPDDAYFKSTSIQLYLFCLPLRTARSISSFCAYSKTPYLSSHWNENGIGMGMGKGREWEWEWK